MQIKPCMALISLLLLLLLPYAAIASSGTGEGTVKIIGVDGKVKPDQIESSDENKSSNSNTGSSDDSKQGYWEDGIKGVQTAIENSAKGIGNWIISQLMQGSVDIYEADVSKSTEQLVKEGKAVEDVDAKTITYQINYKMIDPFAPTFTKQVLLVTGGFYICEIFLVMIGSLLVLMFAINHPEAYIDFMASFTGEERPYTYKTTVLTSIVAMSYWVGVLLLVFVVTGTRNLLVVTMVGHAVTLPMMYVNDFPTQLLTASSAYLSAFQTAMAELGIYVIAALTFVVGGITDVYLMLGSYKKAVILNRIVWGTYIICNLVDLFIVGLIAAGTGTYQLTGNPVFVTAGVVSAALINFVILAAMIIYAIIAGKQIIIQRIHSNRFLSGGMY